MDEARPPLADDPTFLDSLMQLDRGLTGEPLPPAPPRPPAARPAIPTRQPSHTRIRTQGRSRVTLPPSITAPFEALTIPEAPPVQGDAAQSGDADGDDRRPLVELFPLVADAGGEVIAPPSVAAAQGQTAAPAPAARQSADLVDAGDLELAAVKPSPYESFYGLSEKPFSLSTDPRFFYHSTPHDAVSQQLLSSIRDRTGLVVLTGEFGSGKTTLCRVVMEQLDRRTLTSLVSDPALSGDELLRKVLADFGVSRDEHRGHAASSRELIVTLRSFVESLASLEARAVVIVDDAHSVRPDVLEHIRTLCEAAEASSHLQVVLVGQPALTALLRRSENRVLQQRVAVRASLEALPADEISDYVAHRLSIAGGTRLEFRSEALARIHRLSLGSPRIVNLLCDRVLARGFEVSAAGVDVALVDLAADDLDLDEPRSKAASFGIKAVSIAALILCVLAGAGLAAWLFRDAAARALIEWQDVPAITPPARRAPAPWVPPPPPVGETDPR